MATRKVLLLGGYGGTGREVARLLRRFSDLELVIAGRDAAKARAFAAELDAGAGAGPGPTQGIALDAARPEDLRRAFKEAQLAVALSATPACARSLAEAALAAGIDYVDCHFQDAAHHTIAPLSADVERAGLRFVTQAGFHPGLPAVFVRAAAPSFDRFDEAAVAMAMGARVEDPYALREIVEAIQEYRSEVCEGGRWREASYRDARSVDFGAMYGAKSCLPLALLELRPLPAELGLKGLGAYAAGWDWVTDWVISPLAVLAGAVRKGLGARLFARMLGWALNRSGLPSGVAFLVDASGLKDGRPRKLRLAAYDTVDPYHFTAAAICAAVLQAVDSPPKGPGVHLMGAFVEPERALRDLARMGVRVERKG